MTITAPTPIPAALLPLPDPADRATFSLRKLEQLRWANVDLAPGALALATVTYNNALDAKARADEVYANTVATASNTAQAAQYAGAAKFVTGAYAIGAVLWSPVNALLYRKVTSSGSSATDPSADNVNWRRVNTEPAALDVVTSPVTVVAGLRHFIKTAGAAVLNVPALAEGDVFEVKVENGRSDNTLNPGTYAVEGIAGVLTIDGAYSCFKLQVRGTTLRLV